MKFIMLLENKWQSSEFGFEINRKLAKVCSLILIHSDEIEGPNASRLADNRNHKMQLTGTLTALLAASMANASTFYFFNRVKGHFPCTGLCRQNQIGLWLLQRHHVPFSTKNLLCWCQIYRSITPGLPQLELQRNWIILSTWEIRVPPSTSRLGSHKEHQDLLLVWHY